jgi:hypothetical protein
VACGRLRREVERVEEKELRKFSGLRPVEEVEVVYENSTLSTFSTGLRPLNSH